MKQKACQNGDESNLITKLVKDTNDIEGDLVEVGVYEGGSSVYIFESMNKNKNLFLCDSFEEGFVGVNEFDPAWIKNCHAMQGSYEGIKDFYKDNSNVKIIKGDFPKSIGNTLDSNKFSFVHLDVDIYLPTFNSLNFFYPRMSVGGVILTHDYNHTGDLRGVKKAFDDFFKDKPEQIVAGGNITSAYIIKQ